MRKGISLGTAIILAGFLGITLPGCSDDKNTSGTGGDAARSSGGATGSKSSPGGSSSATGTGSGTTGPEAVDQQEAALEVAQQALGEVDHN